MTLKQKIIFSFKKASLIISVLASIATIITCLILLLPKKLPDLSGHWELTTIIEETTYAPYKNGKLEVKYKISFIQKGDGIEGTGEKFWEKINGIEKFYDSKQKTAIIIRGKIENNFFSATIFERGTQRETSGFIIFEIKKKNKDTIIGRFNSTAANSSGTAVLIRKK